MSTGDARVAATIRGVVQGVGFRPFVHRLAQRWQLSGWVRNRAGVVELEAQGPLAQLQGMLLELSSSPPVGARIAQLETSWLPTAQDSGFSIRASQPEPAPGERALSLTPDRATCQLCQQEHDTPGDPRHDYPFIACSDCGPRFSQIWALPYDRNHTALAGFEPCTACWGDYHDPDGRRFHAENVACAACGPRLRFWAQGEATEQRVIERVIEALRRGQIGAIKGVGGYHLVCDAEDARAVTELRARKGRDQKPFAVLVASAEAATRWCELSSCERRVLAGSERPIVLLRRRLGAPPLASVAADSHLLGVMLPYTALHTTLARRFGGPLVLTSGNRSREPMATTEAEAMTHLGEIADFFVHHDRPIAMRVDDSVVRVVEGEALIVRAGRGLAPMSFELDRPVRRPLIALGGELKSSFSVAAGHTVTLSHHIGDLGDVDTESALEHAIEHCQRLLGCAPERIAHDLHPDFGSTHLAASMARRVGCPTVAVQHHHAHFAACLLEARHSGPAVGVIFDGLGLGVDGALWGGEVLVGDAGHVQRFAHLRYVRAPGGDRAAEQPWRMALAHLVDAGESTDCLRRFASQSELVLVRRLCERGLASPWTSSVGRLFDAVAAILGLAGENGFEARAAALVEAHADRAQVADGYTIGLLRRSDGIELDTRPLVRAICGDRARGVPIEIMAAKFHRGLCDTVTSVARLARAELGLSTVALSGGVFMNGLLLAQCSQALAREGFVVLWPRRAPPNDGGLALGQFAVAATA